MSIDYWVADCILQVAEIHTHGSCLGNCLCLGADFIIQATESIASNRNQTCCFLHSNLALPVGEQWELRKRPCTSSHLKARLAESWLLVQQASSQQNSLCWRMRESYSLSVFPPCSLMYYMSWPPYATQVMQALWGNSRCSDSRSEMLTAIFLALFPRWWCVYERDKTAFEPSTYKSNSSGKWPPQGPRLGNGTTTKKRTLWDKCSEWERTATAGVDTYGELVVEELYKQNEMVLKTVVML